MKRERIQRNFFLQPTLEVARNVLGKRLVRIEPSGGRISGIINEAEAYVGTEDLGCHAKAGRTRRNRSMWGSPGHAYVYFTYGMHWLLNFVTEEEGRPAAVLIRSLIVEEGCDLVALRRRGRPERDWTNGPAKLTTALEINSAFDGADLCSNGAVLFVEDSSSLPDEIVRTGPRIGLFTVPEPWKSVSWRFWVVPQDYLDWRDG
jgi:DNA-3-methyladenine glycosylase